MFLSTGTGGCFLRPRVLGFEGYTLGYGLEALSPQA